jgi:hypothetical protein
MAQGISATGGQVLDDHIHRYGLPGLARAGMTGSSRATGSTQQHGGFLAALGGRRHQVDRTDRLIINNEVHDNQLDLPWHGLTRQVGDTESGASHLL